MMAPVSVLTSRAPLATASPSARGLAVANGALLVSTDTGAIISFGQADNQPSAWILF